MKRTINFRGRNPRVECDGTSLWMNTEGLFGYVNSIRIEHTDYGSGQYILIWVDHTIPHWEVYSDQGFEEDISDILTNELGVAVNVAFTEQGMQNHLLASMEPVGDWAFEHLKNFVEAA